MIRCNLFGHKFIAKQVQDYRKDGQLWRSKRWVATDYCTRCGARRTP